MQAISIPISIFLIIIYLYKIWNKNPTILFIGSLFFIEMIWQIVSIVWIDGGAYISEQLRYSYYTGASFRFCVLILPFAILYPYFLDKELSRRKYANIEHKINKRKYFRESDLYIIIFLIVVYILIDIIISGKIPLLKGGNYSSFYASYSKLPLSSVIHNYFFPFICLLLGVLTGENKFNKKRKNFIILFIIIIFIQILLNNKFYGLYDYTLHYLTGYFALVIFSKKNKKLPIKYIVVVLAIVGLLLYLCYTKYSKTMINPMQFLLDRIFALQNHTFWGIDRLWITKNLSVDWNGFGKELISGFSELGLSRLNSNYGIARVMYLVTTNKYASDMISTGYLFAGSYITVMLSYIGYIPAFLMSIIFAFVVAKISINLYKCIKTKNYIMLYFVFFVFRRFYEYFRVGNIGMILNWKFLFIYMILLLYSFNVRVKRR